MDLKTTFLNGELTEEIFMKQPESFVEEGKDNIVCRLKCSIYGLKQSPRCWNAALDEHPRSLNRQKGTLVYTCLLMGNLSLLLFLLMRFRLL